MYLNCKMEKAERVYVTSKGSSGHVEIFAELTGIDADQMFALSGIGIDS